MHNNIIKDTYFDYIPVFLSNVDSEEKIKDLYGKQEISELRRNSQYT